MAKISLEAYDSGSQYSFGDKMEQAKFPSSAFALNHKLTTTYDNAGQVQAIFLHRCNPHEDFDISVKSLFRALPSVVPLYSRQRDYIYFFGSRLSDLWDDAQVFVDKGYTGDYYTHIPVLSSTYNYKYSDGDVVEAGSLADNLGIPIGTPAEKLEGINALPFMFLFRIWRDYFCNRNYFINDRVVLPHDDTRFRLNSNGELLSAKDLGISFKFEICKANFNGYQPDFTHSKATFTQFCHDYAQDYFTSALPWPQRGTAKTLDGKISFDADVLAKVAITNTGTLSTKNITVFNHSKNGLSATDQFHQNILGYGTNSTNYSSFDSDVKSTTNPIDSYSKLYSHAEDVPFQSTFTVNDLREIVINQQELEKMARTDGSYAEFGLTFFGEKSKNSIDYRPTYIGGSYSNIQYTEVLQTSAQYTSEEGTVSPIGSPLGTYGGHGICANNGYVGHFHSDDFGYIMALHCVMPDTYYCNGLDRIWTDLEQSDLLIPERAKLGLRPILNQELFFSGTEAQDENIWAWQNIYDEYRYIPNRISGKIADPSKLDFIPYTQARLFNQLVNYGSGFAEANDVRKDYLQASTEVAFTCEFAFDIRATRPLPYKPVPAQLIN